MKCLGAVAMAAAVLWAIPAVARAIGFDDLPDPARFQDPPDATAPDAPDTPAPDEAPVETPPEKPSPKKPAPGEAPPPEKPAAGADESYAWRDAHCPLNQPCQVESLALPLSKVAAQTPPHKVLAGRRALEGGTNPRERIWAVVPLVEGHGDFLERYAAARTDDDRFRLIEWCGQRRFAACAEFVMRDILFAHWGDLSGEAYRRALGLWLPLGERRPSPFTFDLPVRGVWYVQKGTAEVHRRNHSSAFTVNLYIQVNGQRTRGPENDLAGYFAWGQPFYAVGDGVIMKVDDGFPDPPVGHTGDWRVANAIYQDLGGGVHVHYGHIRKGSALVKVGERVARGQPLGQVGNSGSDGKPHLHFTLLDGDWFSVPGRFRYEQMTARGWVRRDAAPLEEDTFIRPPTAPAKAETPKPTKRAPRLPMPIR